MSCCVKEITLWVYFGTNSAKVLFVGIRFELYSDSIIKQ